MCVVCVFRVTGSDRGLTSSDASVLYLVCELSVSRVSASIMYTDILSFHVDDESVKSDDMMNNVVAVLARYNNT